MRSPTARVLWRISAPIVTGTARERRDVNRTLACGDHVEMLRAVTLLTARYRTFRQLTPIPASHATVDSLARELSHELGPRQIAPGPQHFRGHLADVRIRIFALRAPRRDRDGARRQNPVPAREGQLFQNDDAPRAASRAAIAAQSPRGPRPHDHDVPNLVGEILRDVFGFDESDASDESDESDASAPHAAAGAFARRPPEERGAHQGDCMS